MKYADQPYTKKPSKNYGNAGPAAAAGGNGANAVGGTANHNSVEEVSLDGSNKLITYGNTFR